MTPIVAAGIGTALVGGLLLVVVGVTPVADDGRPRSSRWARPRPVAALLADDLPPSEQRRRRIWLGVAVGAGLLVWLLSGWVLAVVVLPLVVVGIPVLLSSPPAAIDVDRLTAIEQWTRGMSGVLTVGSGIEHAIIASLGSTPEAIAPMVGTLVARLNARWPTPDALRAFADDLDDATGDLVAAALILAARRRGPGLARVLGSLADSVAEDVAVRRKVEAERAKPRTTARAVTLITLGVVGVGALNGAYLRPYGTALGQLVLACIALGFVACLAWMRALTLTSPAPRLLNTAHPSGPTPRPGSRRDRHGVAS
jgi:tight adherence protein B